MNPENENGVQDPNKAATQPASAAPATPVAQAEATPAATAPAAPAQQPAQSTAAPTQTATPAAAAPVTTEQSAPASVAQTAETLAQATQPVAQAETVSQPAAAPATDQQPTQSTAAPTQTATPAATATATTEQPTQAPAATASQPVPAVQPAQPAPAPQPVPQPAVAPAPVPQPLPQPVAQPAPAPTPVAQPVQQPTVQDIQPSAPLNPLANNANALGTGVITPSSDLNSFDNTNIGFVPVGEAIPKKKNKGLKAIIILLIFVGLGALGYFVVYPWVFRTYFANPKNVYDAVIKESFKKISNSVTETVHSKSINDVQFTFDSNVESLKDYIGYTYGINIGVDPDEELVQTGITIKDKDNVEHSYATYVKNKSEYLRFSSYRELILAGEADMNKQTNLFVSYNDLLKTASKMNSNNINYLVTKIGDLLAESISADKLLKEDASITVNGVVTKVISNKYTINNQVLSDTLAFIKDGILKDDKALDIISELTETDKSQLKRNIEEIDTKVSILKNDEEIVISIFTAGLKNEIVGYELSDNKYEGNAHLYMKDDFFELKAHALIKDEETGKELEHNLLIIGNKVEGKTRVGVKYNDEEIVNLILNTWNENIKDVDYDVKTTEKNYKGNVKYSKDVNKERGKYSFNLDINVGKEFIKVGINVESTWNADVANIMIGSAKTLSEDEVKVREQEFIQTLQNTPFYKLFTTTDGNFDLSILDYYNTHQAEPPVIPKDNPEPNVESNPPRNVNNNLDDACFKVDSNGNYKDEKASCANFVCTIEENGETIKKECNVA